MKSDTSFSATIIGTLALSALLGITACASTSPPSGASPSPTEAKEAIYDMLPQDIKDKGFIKVATDPQFGPPTNFHPGENPSEWAGFEADLVRALEDVMGIEIRQEEAKFETIIPGVRSGRYDLGINALTDSVERQQTVDMIDWLAAGKAMIIVRKGNPQGITDLPDLCGKSMALVGGSSDHERFERWSSENCGDKPINLMLFKTRPDCVLALRTDRVAVTAGGTGFTLNVVHDYENTNSEVAGELEIVEVSSLFDEESYSGIAIQKGRTELQEALMAAVEQLMDDGTYDEILDHWKYPESRRIYKPLLNAATA